MTDAKRRKQRIRWALYIMLIPGIFFTLIYSYGPLVGLSLAFQKFEITGGLFGSPWVGFDNFTYIFKLRDFRRALTNTLFIASIKIVLNLFFPLFVSILLNEIRSIVFKRSVQTFIYLPFFISWVILAGVFLEILSPEKGLVNVILNWMGFDSIFFLGKPGPFPWVIIFTDVWKGFGMGTIIYLAALTGIDPNLYEAAAIDGANRFKRMVHITLPGIVSTIVLNGTLSLGNVLNAGFDQIQNLINTNVYKTGDIIDTYVYRVGIQSIRGTLPRYDITTAMGLFKSVVSTTLISIAYFCAYKFADYRIF